MSLIVCCSAATTPTLCHIAAAAAASAYLRLHNAGIQVILDVVYNHTAELDDKHPYTISMR